MPAARSPLSVTLADAARGLGQQMILWGHDVNHPQGNALRRSGLTRTRSPGLQGTSCYSTPWENGSIELHGAVASWTAAGGGRGCIFCREANRIDLWVNDHAPVPGRDNGQGGTVAERWHAFQPFLRWLVAYETWIAGTLEADWRARTWKALRNLPRSKPWLPPAAALQWWRLALLGAPPRPKSLNSPF